MRFALLTIALLLLLPPRIDAADDSIESLAGADGRPEGVVFEIMAWQDDSWDWAAPLLLRHVERLRVEYPGIEMALVSHGAELFDLARRLDSQPQAPRELARLAGEGLEIHVCGEYAAWKRLGPMDFPAFVDVAASGSAQLAAYLELGFSHIRLEQPHAAD